MVYWIKDGPGTPETTSPGQRTEWVTCYWLLGGVGYYLSLRSIQHQIIELAEDALLQLVPGDAPVLMHEKRRSKPEEEEEERVHEDSALVDINTGIETLSQFAYISIVFNQ